MQLTQPTATTINTDAPAQLYHRTRETWTLAYRTLDGALHHVDIDGGDEDADPDALACLVRRDLASINISLHTDWQIDVFGRRLGRKFGRITMHPHRGEVSTRSEFQWSCAQ